MSKYRENPSWKLLREFGRLHHNLDQINRAARKDREAVDLYRQQLLTGAPKGCAAAAGGSSRLPAKRKRLDKALAEANRKLAKSEARKEESQRDASRAAAQVQKHGEVLIISVSDCKVFLKMREEHGFDGGVRLAKWNQMEMIAEMLDEMGISYTVAD